MGVALVLPLFFLVAVAPVWPWRSTNVETLAERLRWPAVGGAAVMVLAVVLGETGLGTVAGYGLAGFAAGSALRQIALATRRQGRRGPGGRTNGGVIVQIGVIRIPSGILPHQAHA